MASIKTTGIPFAQHDYGIKLGVFPSSDARFGVQIDRSTNSSTGPWRPLKGLTPAGGQWNVVTDFLPNTTNRYYYRARHTAIGYDDSTNIVVSATPARILPGQRVEVPALTGIGVPVDIYLSSANTVRVGSAGNTGSIRKRLRIPASAFVPVSTAISYGRQSGYLHPSVLSTAGPDFETFEASIVLPGGVTIEEVSAFMHRLSTEDQARIRLRRFSSTGAANIFTADHSTIGWSTVGSSTLAEIISTNWAYHLNCELATSTFTGTPAAGGRIMYVDTVYTMPDYAKTV